MRSGLYRDAVLATSDSNVAVDNLLEGCIKQGLRAVRLGKPEAISDHLRQHCVDFMAPAGASKQEVHDLKTQVIRNAQVVCATCIGVGSEVLERHQFGAVLMDEATQATEASTMVRLYCAVPTAYRRAVLICSISSGVDLSRRSAVGFDRRPMPVASDCSFTSGAAGRVGQPLIQPTDKCKWRAATSAASKAPLTLCYNSIHTSHSPRLTLLLYSP